MSPLPWTSGAVYSTWYSRHQWTTYLHI